MENYTLSAYKKGGHYLIPKNAWETELFLCDHC